MRKLIVTLMALIALPAAALAQERMTGPVFTSFGSWAPIDNMQDIPADQHYRAIFDASKGAEPGDINSRIDSAARYINLLVSAGVPRENIEVAIVVHGSASWDVVTNAAYARKYPGKENATAPAIAEMAAQGVEFYICGQAAHHHGIANEDLLPGVTMTLSQTVATTILQNRGFHEIP